MTACSDGFPIGGPGEYWYRKASEAFVTFEGDKGKFLTQAALWLTDKDLAFAEIAWNLVQMEKDDAADA